MIPDKELNELVRALRNTPEYAAMQKNGKNLFGNASLYRQLLEYEKEQSLLMEKADDNGLAKKMENLRAEYKELFEKEEVKGFIDAANKYRQIVEACFVELEKTFDI